MQHSAVYAEHSRHSKEGRDMKKAVNIELIKTYRGYDITKEGGYYVIVFCGDELVFDTVAEAESFVDDMAYGGKA